MINPNNISVHACIAQLLTLRCSETTWPAAMEQSKELATQLIYSRVWLAKRWSVPSNKINRSQYLYDIWSTSHDANPTGVTEGRDGFLKSPKELAAWLLLSFRVCTACYLRISISGMASTLCSRPGRLFKGENSPCHLGWNQDLSQGKEDGWFSETNAESE